MRKTLYIPVLTVLAFVLAYGCKPIQKAQTTIIKPMPATFAESSPDSANTATIPWRQYFNDPHLISIIDTALINNWDVSIALQRIRAAKSDVLLSKGALKPVVEGSAAASLRRFGLYTMDGAGNITTDIEPGRIIPTNLPDYFIGLQTSWEVDIWGKLRNKKKAAASRFLSTIEGRNIVVTNLVAEIATAYYELLSLDQALVILNENITLQENAVEMVKEQKEAAAANELAVEQFEARLLNLKDMRLDVMQQVFQTESRINLLAGRYPQPIARDSSSLTNSVAIDLKLGIPSALLQNRPDIRQAEFELIASKADVKAARAAFYPSLNINGSVGFQAFKTGLLFSTPESIAYGLFGSLTAPLINRSAIKAEFNRANAVQLEALYNYQKTIVNGYVEVYNEVQKIKTLEQRVAFKTQEVSVLTRSTETSSELFTTGRANYLEVLVVQQNVLQSRLELIDTKKGQRLSTVNIYKALGGGWK